MIYAARLLCLFSFATSAHAGTTRRSVLMGIAATTLMRTQAVAVGSSAVRPDELAGLNRYEFVGRAIDAVLRRAGLSNLGTPGVDFPRVLSEIGHLSGQPTSEHFVRYAFPHFNEAEITGLGQRLDQLVDEDAARLLAQSNLWEEERSRAASGSRADSAPADEPPREICSRRLMLPDVRRDWTWGPNLGRPL